MHLKNLKAAARLLRKENNFLIACHADPDGDTIGSALGLMHILKKMGKAAAVFSADEIPAVYQFLPGINSIKKNIPQKQRFNVIISVDAGDVKRISAAEKILPLGNFLVDIDHHPDNTFFGDLNLVAPVSCVAELIYRVAEELGIKMPAAAATCLYVAMMTDTGNFKYENTTAETFDIAKHLVAGGANPAECAINVYEEKPFAALTLQAHCILNAQRVCGGKIIWTTVKQADLKKFKAKDDDLNGLVDALRSVKGVEVAVLIREVGPKKIKVNFRAKRYANVQRMAKALGGGGHIRSAGAVIDGSIPAVEKSVLAVVTHQSVSPYITK
ncbi:MAG: bifunctional oligoribonuclease/PAP phosphatase NrnA [Candidatus Margulisiibacteriota bacterium]